MRRWRREETQRMRAWRPRSEEGAYDRAPPGSVQVVVLVPSVRGLDYTIELCHGP